MSEIIDNHHNVQQNVMEILIDRSQLRMLAEPTIFPTEGGYPASSWITRAKLHWGIRWWARSLSSPAVSSPQPTPRPAGTRSPGKTDAEHSVASFRYYLSASKVWSNQYL
jgi:hypothetical protein